MKANVHQQKRKQPKGKLIQFQLVVLFEIKKNKFNFLT